MKCDFKERLMKQKLCFFFASLSLLGFVNQAEAVLASVKSTGMAATAIAYPQDALCAAYNPAGIVWVGDRIDSEIGWLHDTGHARITDSIVPTVNGRRDGMRTKNVVAPSFGITKNFCCDCVDIAFGLVLYNRNYQKTTYKNPIALFGTTKPGLEYLHETIAPSVAIRFWNRHSLGVSIDWQIQRLKVNGLQNFDNPLFSSNPGHVTNRGYSYAQGVTATFGYRLEITDSLAIGLTYQPKTVMHKFRKYSGFLAEQGRLDIPEKIGAGVSWDFLPNWTVCFDWEYIRWSHVKALHNPLALNLFADQLGDDHGSGFGFRNQNYYRVGLEWRINCEFTVRAGFRHANTPIRRSQTAVNTLTLDCVENFITVGGTWNFTPCNELSTFFAYGFEHKVKGKNAIPVVPFGGGNVSLSEQKYALGFALGWKY